MISNDLLFWKELIINNISILKRNIDGKNVFIWGAFSKGNVLREILEENGIDVSGFLDSFKYGYTYNGKNVICVSDVVTDKHNNYIFIAIDGIRNEILSLLNDNGWSENSNYYYLSKNIPEFEISSFRGKYEDKYGNVFENHGSDRVNGLVILCKGNDNHVILNGSLEIVSGGSIKIEASFGTKIIIGKYVRIDGNVFIHAQFGGTVIIGDGVTIQNDCIFCSTYGGFVEISKKVSIGRRFYVSSGKTSPVKIGFDCMISHDVSIHGTNEHSIFDIANKKSISLEREKPVNIDDHVWLCKNSTVLYGTNIGNGSIVGACSVAKGNYPKECIIVGNIGKVIRDNCTWDRRKGIDFDDLQKK